MRLGPAIREIVCEVVYIGPMKTARNHTFRERQSLALNSAVARRLADEPDAVISRARNTLARWKSIPGSWCEDLTTWEEIVARGNAAEIYRLLTGDDEHSIRLRQSSPFSVQLHPKERLKILRESNST